MNIFPLVFSGNALKFHFARYVLFSFFRFLLCISFCASYLLSRRLVFLIFLFHIWMKPFGRSRFIRNDHTILNVFTYALSHWDNKRCVIEHFTVRLRRSVFCLFYFLLHFFLKNEIQLSFLIVFKNWDFLGLGWRLS